MVDACHSGTGTRGPALAVVRGDHLPMVSEKFDLKTGATNDHAGVFKESTKMKLLADAATYVVISAAQAQQLNWETTTNDGKPVGALSYAFTRAMSNLNGSISYRGLFASIENIMREKSPRQKPVLEGDGTDRELFGGNYVVQKPYFTIVAQTSKDVVEINAGTVSGITTGSVVGFYPYNTFDPSGKKPLQKGKVISAGNFSSMVKFDMPGNELLKKSPWVFLTELSYGSQKIKVAVNDKIPGAHAKAKAALTDFKIVEIDPNGDLSLDTIGLTDTWIFKYSKGGGPFGDESFSLSDTGVMKETLRRFARFQYLQNLTFHEQGLSAKVELVFLDENGNIDSAKQSSRTKLTGLELQEGDEVYLRIINTGDKRFYINIVDIQPDGKINPMLPNKHLKDKNNYPAPLRPEDCTVAKKDSLLLKSFLITILPPYGEETLKIFLSTEKLDLEDILTEDSNDHASRGPGGVLNNLAKVFKSAKLNDDGSRGVGTAINTQQNGTIFNVNFNIVPNSKNQGTR